jgi:hypothetical protein
VALSSRSNPPATPTNAMYRRSKCPTAGSRQGRRTSWSGVHPDGDPERRAAAARCDHAEPPGVAVWTSPRCHEPAPGTSARITSTSCGPMCRGSRSIRSRADAEPAVITRLHADDIRALAVAFANELHSGATFTQVGSRGEQDSTCPKNDERPCTSRAWRRASCPRRRCSPMRPPARGRRTGHASKSPGSASWPASRASRHRGCAARWRRSAAKSATRRNTSPTCWATRRRRSRSARTSTASGLQQRPGAPAVAPEPRPRRGRTKRPRRRRAGVRMARLELARCYPLVPETSASTNSATFAYRAVYSEEGTDAIGAAGSQEPRAGVRGALRFFPCKGKELVAIAALLVGAGGATIGRAAL